MLDLSSIFRQVLKTSWNRIKHEYISPANWLAKWKNDLHYKGNVSSLNIDNYSTLFEMADDFTDVIQVLECRVGNVVCIKKEKKI